MMRKIDLAGAFVIAVIVAATAEPALNPALGVIFPAKHARELLRQCSRETPHPVEGTWTPGAAQIGRLEKAYPRAFARAVAAHGFYQRDKLVEQIDRYARQYGGIVIAGRKVIYVNGFLASDIDFDGTDLAKRNWRHEANIVCDGGPSFFGAEFDPKTGRFDHFAFNGVA